ncbi:heparan-alpha-glucosaminide N-acetyltransferase domain-containing protein [Blastococcus saxobsidens]|uniref:Putative membrane protein YeiB n=1 Tax=Blastococcus saxobsidens TaxID=138336 RepID=A0A4Q7Y3L3_9ACTN|nr:heparan-alpha-glucosaminide N-acetyltransferase domain-containing protein [Blastococcus saxobsidens]RZU31452.1 putative membrane protein YeiB [Blastococcus saxobsidens]
MSRAAGRDRIGGLDLARGLAVLGMFGAHLDIGAELTTDPSTWAAVVDGRSSVLFATLAGVSIALLSGGTRPVDGIELVQARLRIVVRAAWVFAIGAVLEWLDTFVAIILGVYAVLFVLALPFLRMSPRRLFLLAGALAVVGPPLDALLGQVLSVADTEAHYVAELLVTGSYPALLWLAFLLVGLGVGRLDLEAAGVRARLAASGAVAAVLGYGGGWLTTRLLAGGEPSRGPAAGFASPVGEWQAAWFTGAEPHSGTTSELVGSAGFALLVLALGLVAADLLPLPTAPLRAVGALALSVYSAQVVVLWALLQVDPQAARGTGAWVLFCLTALSVAGMWRWRLRRGPLERLLTWSSTRAAAVAPSSPTYRARS